MFRAWSPRLRPVLAGLGLALLAGTSWGQAWQFGSFAIVSDTMGVNAGRICLGEGSRQDIGCPTYAPSVSSGGLLTATSVATGGLTVTGATSATTISATVGSFTSLTVGGLAVVGGASPDRVVSGTTSVVVVSTTGFISLTQLGTNTAWFDPVRGLVTLGVSATGVVSTSNGVFFGSVTGGSGLALTNGTSGPLDRISTSGVASGASLAMAVADIGTISFTLAGTAGAAYLHPTLGFVGPGVSTTGTISATNIFTSGLLTATRVTATNVSGSVGDFTTLRVNGVAVTPDRITSGTDAVVVNGATDTVSFSLGGSTVAYVHPTLGLVAPGVSTTGPVSSTRLFVGSTTGGSGLALTNGTSGPLDRISTSGVASGASLAMAVANIGTISFTLGGTAGAAYLHPTLGYVGPGVSTTAPVSATRLFVGTDAIVNGRVSASAVQVGPDGGGCTTQTLGTIRTDPVTGKLQVCRI